MDVIAYPFRDKLVHVNKGAIGTLLWHTRQHETYVKHTSRKIMITYGYFWIWNIP